MIPLRLNLLSEEKRRAHKRIMYVQFIKNSLEMALLIICVCSIFLLIGQWWLQNRLQDLASHSIVSDSRYAHTNQRVDSINARVKKIDTIQKTSVLWTPIVDEFTKAIPSTITLSTCSMNITDHSISVSGVAQTRDSLLSFKEHLESLPWVKPVTIPIDQLTNKENVNFSFSIGIKE